MLCLIHFYDDWRDFRLAELKQLLKRLNADYNFIGSVDGVLDEEQVFLLVDIHASEDVIVELCAKAVLIRGVYEVWEYGESFAELLSKLTIMYTTGSPLIACHKNGQSWSLELQTYCQTLKMEEKQTLRDTLRFIDLQGPVDLKNPEVTVVVTLDYSKHRKEIQGRLYEQVTPYPDVPAYCGRLVGRGGMKEELKKYSLKKRLFLGPTTLDHALALIMCNLACVAPRQLVLDPFVGTASVLVAASHLKAHCMGTDIDIRVLKGGMYAGASRHAEEVRAVPGEEGTSTSPKRDIFANFLQYGLAPPELVRMDLHSIERHMQMSHMVVNREDGVFNAIVTDPPYGIRAGGRKSGKADGVDYVIDAEKRKTHMPITQNYPVEEVMLDLMHAAARLLVVGGRLCYLIPTPYDFQVSDLPQHPCLQVEQLCLQSLSTRHGRHAVLVRKTQAYTPEQQREFDAYRQRVMSGQDAGGFGSLMTKLEAALAPGSREDEGVLKRKSKTCERRQVSRANRAAYREQRQDNADPAVAAGTADVEGKEK